MSCTQSGGAISLGINTFKTTTGPPLPSAVVQMDSSQLTGNVATVSGGAISSTSGTLLLTVSPMRAWLCHHDWHEGADLTHLACWCRTRCWTAMLLEDPSCQLVWEAVYLPRITAPVASAQA